MSEPPSAEPLPRGPLPARSTGGRRATPIVFGVVGVVLVIGGIAAFALRGPKPIPTTPKDPPITKVDPPVAKIDLPPVKNDPPPAPTGPLRVAVLKFKNVGADQKLQPLEAGVGETAVTRLAGTPGVTLIEREDLDSDIGELDKRGDVHFDPSTIARMGQLKGIEVAVQGGFQRAGKEVRITARLVKVENGEVLSTFAVTHSVHDLFGAQDALADGLLPKLKLLAVGREKK
jgi:TolB-like protein